MIALLTKDGWFVIYKFNIENKKIDVIDRIKIELNSENEESPFTLAIHENIFAIALIDSRKILSRLMIFELENRILDFKTEIDVSQENFSYVRAMELHAVYGDKVIFTAVTCSNPTVLLNFSYDTNKKILKELKGLRKVFDAGSIIKLVKMKEGGFMTTDHAGKIVKINFKE